MLSMQWNGGLGYKFRICSRTVETKRQTCVEVLGRKIFGCKLTSNQQFGISLHRPYISLYMCCCFLEHFQRSTLNSWFYVHYSDDKCKKSISTYTVWVNARVLHRPVATVSKTAMRHQHWVPNEQSPQVISNQKMQLMLLWWALFWYIQISYKKYTQIQFVLHRKHVTSPLQSKTC
jgi:hypothetical protein